MYRLNKVWAEVDADSRLLFTELSAIFSEDNNHSMARELLFRSAAFFLSVQLRQIVWCSCSFFLLKNIFWLWFSWVFFADRNLQHYNAIHRARPKSAIGFVSA